MEARIGGVMLVAESAGQRSADEWALLIGSVALAMIVIGIVDWFNNRTR